jgi:hypothetical protein
LVGAGALLAGLWALLADRRRKAEQAATWKQTSEHNDRRADAAEAVVEAVTREATERQASLEETIREDAQARIDAGDPGARRRVQDGWAARAKADRPAGDEPAVPARTASGTGSHPAQRGPMRGRR